MKYFTTDTRDNGTTFTKLTDDAPEWIKDCPLWRPSQ